MTLQLVRITLALTLCLSVYMLSLSLCIYIYIYIYIVFLLLISLIWRRTLCRRATIYECHGQNATVSDKSLFGQTLKPFGKHLGKHLVNTWQTFGKLWQTLGNHFQRIPRHLQHILNHFPSSIYIYIYTYRYAIILSTVAPSGLKRLMIFYSKSSAPNLLKRHEAAHREFSGPSSNLLRNGKRPHNVCVCVCVWGPRLGAIP